MAIVRVGRVITFADTDTVTERLALTCLDVYHVTGTATLITDGAGSTLWTIPAAAPTGNIIYGGSHPLIFDNGLGINGAATGVMTAFLA